MRAPDDLAGLYQPRLVEPARVAELARQWRDAVAENAAIRRWIDGRFIGESHQRIDDQLAEACNHADRPLARAMAEVMGHCDGFFATDMFLYWRARELHRRDILALAGDKGQGYQGVQARRL